MIIRLSLRRKPDGNEPIQESVRHVLPISARAHIEGCGPGGSEQNEFMMNPTVTNGAYKFVKFAKDQYVQLTANEQYYEGAPNIKDIYIKMMPATNLAAQLQTETYS